MNLSTELAFETVGNATLICYEGAPILVTDPWLHHSAYFGSWTLSHRIPPEQLEAIQKAKYIWFSHGHPDHLNQESLEAFRDHEILLPNHVGARIRNDLQNMGFKVRVLEDRKWFPLSKKIKVLCVSDPNQDAVLIVDLDGTLVVNANDAGDYGSTAFVRRTVQKYDQTFLIALSGYGDATMINFYSDQGLFIPPVAAQKKPVGPQIRKMMETYGVKYFVPFSSMHRYQRSDSIWANEFVTGLNDYRVGFDSQFCLDDEIGNVDSNSREKFLLPPYIRYDCLSRKYEKFHPEEFESKIIPCEEFGDDWSEELDEGEWKKVQQYFQAPELISESLDFVQLKVGGKEKTISFAKGQFNRGVTFEVPRKSLMDAVQYEVFDDLLIGNFMKTTLHGEWPESKLYPVIDGYLTKCADNGRAKKKSEVKRYYFEYFMRAPLDTITHFAAKRGKDVLRKSVRPGYYQGARKVYWAIRNRVKV